MSRVKGIEKGIGVSQQKDKKVLPRKGGEGEARTYLFEDVYLIIYGPAAVPNVRSLMYSGQQICSRESSKTATDDGNLDASRVWMRIRKVTPLRHLRKAKRSAKSVTLPLRMALNGGKGNLEPHGDTVAAVIEGL
jgi:hypothetical protein